MRRTAFIGLLLAAASAARGGYDVYLQHPRIAGEVTNAHHAGWIRILSYNHGVYLATNAAESGGRAETATHVTLDVTKEVDSTSPLLAKDLCEGGACDRVRLDFTSPGEDGVIVFRLELKDVRVARIASTGMATNSALETLSLEYRDMLQTPGDGIAWTFTPEFETGQPSVLITNAPAGPLANDATNLVLAGTHANLAGGMWWRLVEVEKTRYFLPAGASWSSAVGPLQVGLNTITVYGTNAAGDVASDSVTVERLAADADAPIVDIAGPSPLMLPYAQTSAAIGGTCSAFLVSPLWWTNAASGAGGTCASAGGTWSLVLPELEAGVNGIWVYGSNSAGRVGYDSVVIQRGDGSERPAVGITNAPAAAVPFGVTFFELRGTNNPTVEPPLWWERSTNGPGGVFGSAGGAWSVVVPGLEVGLNDIRILATNHWGERAWDSVTIEREGPDTGGGPFVDITNAPPETLPSGTTAYLLLGTNNVFVHPQMGWYVLTNGAAGSFACAGLAWSVTVTGLQAGLNTAYVFGTNQWGGRSEDFVALEVAPPEPTPVIGITSWPTDGVPYAAVSCLLAGTNSPGVLSPMWWVRGTNLEAGTFAGAGSAWTTTVTGLQVGPNDVYVYGTNLTGGLAYDAVTVSREPPESAYPDAPVIDITNEPPAALEHACAAYTLAGTNSPSVRPGLWWFNVSTETAGAFTSLGGAWSATVPGLAYGANSIYVFGTNDVGGQALDVVTLVREFPPGTRYARPDGTDVFPYTNWAGAARTVQRAADAALPGDFVLVADGTYGVGARVRAGEGLQSRLFVTNAITIQSVNGPAATVLAGETDDGGGDGPNAVRGALLGGGARLVGFTIRGGHTRADGAAQERRGGGVYLESGGALSNCMVENCSAALEGGGLYVGAGSRADRCSIAGSQAQSGGGVYLGGGVLAESVLSNNWATLDGGGGGGGGGGVVQDSLIVSNVAARAGGGVCAAAGLIVERSRIEGNTAGRGGGACVAAGALLRRCTLNGNQAVAPGTAGGGGGVYFDGGGEMENGLLYGNFAIAGGGGVYHVAAGGIVRHATVTDNSTPLAGGGICGAGPGLQINSVVYFNTAGGGGADYDGPGLFFDHCCVSGSPPGPGNTGAPPLFRDRPAHDYRLLTGSPGIDAAVELGATEDLDGVPRPLDGDANGVAAPDMGAFEFVSDTADTDGDTLRDGWELGHGLNPLSAAGADGAAGDPDGDGADNRGEQAADTDPLDAASTLRLIRIERGDTGVRVTFQGGEAVRRHLERAPGPAATGVWTIVHTGEPPTPRTNSVDDAGATNLMQFYRLRVERP